MVLKGFAELLFSAVRGLLILQTPIFVQKGVNLGAPIAVSQNLGPTHFSRDNFIALRVVDVILQQLHVFFRPLVLLLEEALPIVFVPDSFPFALEVGHDWTKRQLGRVRKKISAIYELAVCNSRLVWRRNWPQAASISWPFSRRNVAAIPRSRKIDKNFSCRSSDGRDQGRPCTVLYGIRFTLAESRLAWPARRRACSSESFTPAIKMYSKVSRCLFRDV